MKRRKDVDGNKKRKPWLTLLKWLGAIHLLIGAVIFSFLLVHGVPQAERQAWPVYQRVVAGGTPLDQPEFEARVFIVPPEENAAFDLMPALHRYADKLYAANSTSFLRIQDLSRLAIALRPAQLREMENLKRDLESEFGQVVIASTKPRFSVGYDWGNETLFSELVILSRVGYHAGLEARVFASQGKREEALRSLRLMSRFARFAADTPIGKASVSESAILISQATAAANCAALDPEGSRQYKEIVREARIQPVGRYLRGETFSKVSLARRLDAWNFAALKWFRPALELQLRFPRAFRSAFEGKPGKTDHVGLPSDIFARAFAARALLNVEPVLATLDANGFEKSPGLLQSELNKMRQSKNFTPEDPLDYISDLVASLFRSIVGTQQAFHAKRLISLNFIEIVEFREANGRWPANESEIKGLASDPFAPGKRLRYVKTSDGFKIWSVGPNGVDNGGNLPKGLISSFGPLDLGLRYSTSGAVYP